MFLISSLDICVILVPGAIVADYSRIIRFALMLMGAPIDFTALRYREVSIVRHVAGVD